MKRVLALFLLLSIACAAQDKPAPSLFPMAEGTTWTYRAHVKWTKGEQDLRWTMTVADSFESPEISAALLHGGPWDLAWYQPNVRSGRYLIVRMGATYYLLKDGAAETLADIKAGNIHDFKNRLSDDIWFRMPLHEGETFCAPELEKRSPMDCWAVESVAKDQALKIGKVAISATDAYQLVFRTNPDHEMVTLVPGFGITAWQYMHHGTPAEANLRLIEFRIGK